MEIIYDILIALFDKGEDTDGSPATTIELIFSTLTEEEKKILEEYNFKYEYTDDGKVKIKDDNYIYCSVENDGKNKGISVEETEKYHYYLESKFFNAEEIKTVRNLVISKEGTTVEIIFDKKWR